jgi:hypothetical protein
MSDAYTPRELGLVCGGEWAEQAPKQEVAELAESGEIPEHVRDLTFDADIRERLEELEDSNAEAGFWQGFVHAVRAHVVRDPSEAAKLS